MSKTQSRGSSGSSDVWVVDVGNMTNSIQVLLPLFRLVYNGKLYDGTKTAVAADITIGAARNMEFAKRQRAETQPKSWDKCDNEGGFNSLLKSMETIRGTHGGHKSMQAIEQV
eukprot:Gb_23635 [translate_table: standard]